VVGRLSADWSPEQIAGRLKTKPPAYLKGKKVCLETIYQWIYTGATASDGTRFYHHLRRAKPARRRHYQRAAKQINIPEKVSIYYRLAVIDEHQRIS